MTWREIRRREYNSPQYKRNRKLLLRRNPKCAECERQGRVRAATECDHIVSIRKWIESGLPRRECSGLHNLQVLCAECHERKTAQEREQWQRARYPSFDLRGRRVLDSTPAIQ